MKGPQESPDEPVGLTLSIPVNGSISQEWIPRQTFLRFLAQLFPPLQCVSAAGGAVVED